MPPGPSAARRRFHRDRVFAKRIKVAGEVAGHDLAEIVPGRLDDQQYYLGCTRPRCCRCHPRRTCRTPITSTTSRGGGASKASAE